ncbi:histidine kinase [Caldanaerobacter subterraneus]|uniref:Sensor histidine kinase n=1 Tax=Caldanaerobacter subterraneus TaxID=911092 RepID=A0A7Y2L7J6_9THEO|nr:sensor histidine kinase [Caldanaerobacter subterraneus]
MLYKKLIFSYILIIIIPLIAVGIVISTVTFKYLNEEMKQTAFQTLNQANKNLSKMFDNMKNALLYISMNRELQYNLSLEESVSTFQINREVTSVRNGILYPGIFNDNYSSVEIFALNKEYYPLRLERNNVMSAKIVENQDWFKKTVELNGKLYWYVNRIYGENLISVSRLVYDVKNFKKPIAVVSVDVEVSKIDTVLSDIKLGKNNKIYLIDDKGELVYSQEDENFRISSLKDVYKNNSGFRFIKLNGKQVMLVYNTISPSGWKLVGVFSLEELNEKANRLKNFIQLVAFISLFSAILLSLYFSYTISQPIIRLSNRMKEIEKGNLDMEIDEKWNGEIGVLYASFNYMIRRIKELIQEVYLSKLREKEAELKALQAQINPHFLYNTLDSINWLAVINGIPDISKITNALASILRYSIDKGNSVTTIENELKYVKDYITIQKMRFKDRFEVYFDIEEEILSYKIIKLILQPIVENAIVHGLEDYEGKGEILIKGYFEDGTVVFEIANNGKPIDLDFVNKLLSSPTNDEKSYGIQNVNERIKLYYGIEYGLFYEVKEGVTIARIKIPAVK